MEFEVAWPVGLVLGGVFAVGTFAAARRRPRPPGHRRAMFALSAVLAFGTAIPVGITGFLFVIFSGYCEDAGYCMPRWWVFVGLPLLALAVGLLCFGAAGLRGYRRVG